ncbi:immunoglobulin domain-containing protein, partial [Niastella populi]|uniref:immunoglobulin domain-containing protein n=1 Tax=Niastella populi TaxID=550983 RepID=UPI001A99E7DC
MKDSFVHIFNGSATLINDHKHTGGRLGFAVLILLSFVIPFFAQAQHLDNRKRLDSFQRARTASTSSILKILANTYTVTGGGAYCSGGSGVAVGLSGSQLDTVYQLQLDGVNIGTPVTGTDNPISFGLQTAAGTYTVVANTADGTISMNGQATVSINPIPTPTAGSNTPQCVGSTLNLNANGGVSYTWTGPNGFTSNAQNPVISNATAPASGIYTVMVTDGNGCSATTTTNVTINALPTPTAGSNTPVCAGSTLNLTATGGTSYSWTGPNGFTLNTQNPTINNVTIGASGVYTVTVTD